MGPRVNHSSDTSKIRFYVRFSLVGLLLIVLALYLPTYLNSFIGDDFVQQWRIKEFLNSPLKAYQILNPSWTDWYYRPFQNLWFLGNRLVFGLVPAAYYYLQISWHLLAISLIYHLSRQLSIGRIAAFAAAALFGISAQHQLTVGWISSIGNVVSTTCSLGAFAAYLAYLKKPDRKFLLLITTLLYLLALLSHEEGFVLPIFLVAVRVLWIPKRPIRREESIAALFAIITSITYLGTQITRSNANVGIGENFVPSIIGAISPSNIGRFFADAGLRWLPIDEASRLGVEVGDHLAGGLPATLIALLSALLILTIMVKGSLALRLGLIWAGLHLGLLFLGLYTQRPELFDSRHLYGAWAGVCIALGGILQSLCELLRSNSVNHNVSKISRILVAVVLLMILVRQIDLTQGEEVRMEHHTRLVKEAEIQMKSNLPAPSQNTHVFSTQFILTAPYFAPTASVWYGQPELKGGTLQSLKKYDMVTNEFFLFDYDDGNLYNLLPELQQMKEGEYVVFIWRDKPEVVQWLYEGELIPPPDETFEADVIVGPQNDRRLALRVLPPDEGWVSVSYPVTVPYGARLAYSISGSPGQIFRIKALDSSGHEELLYQQAIPKEDEDFWLDHVIMLSKYVNQEIILKFEVRGRKGEDSFGFWANPRLIEDERE